MDIIHGRKDLPAVGIRSGGVYRKDISPWVAGFLVGTMWYPDTISYTDNSSIRSGAYRGTYFQTKEDATPFEAAMARIMDGITAYEPEKYGTQHTVDYFAIRPVISLNMRKVYARQLGKHAQTDPEHIYPRMPWRRDALLLIVCMISATALPIVFLSDRSSLSLVSCLDCLEDQPYGGYLELLSRYHTIPVVAAGYGISSGRGAVVRDESSADRKRAGTEIGRDQPDSGVRWLGRRIYFPPGQDEWERTGWNTAFAAVPSEHYLWHDLQTEGQNFGLMAFEPGAEAVCILDGDPSEWEAEDVASWNRMA